MIELGSEVLCESPDSFVDGVAIAIIPPDQNIISAWPGAHMVTSEERYYENDVTNYPRVIVKTLVGGQKKFSAVPVEFTKTIESPTELDGYLKLVAINSSKKVEIILTQYNINYESYGTNTYKSIENLWHEIVSGESQLKVSAKGELIRLVKAVEIFVHSPDRKKILFEDNQKFENGYLRYRNHNYIGEKANKNETFGIPTVIRAIKEELGFTTYPKECKLAYLGMRLKEGISKSYPNLRTIRTIKSYQCVVPYKHYKKGGYQEIQESKTTTFVWRSIK